MQHAGRFAAGRVDALTADLHRRDTSPCEVATAIADATASRRTVRSRRVLRVMPKPTSQGDAAATAKLLVVLLAFAWGFNWIAAAVALREVSPWSLRFDGAGISPSHTGDDRTFACHWTLVAMTSFTGRTPSREAAQTIGIQEGIPISGDVAEACGNPLKSRAS